MFWNHYGVWAKCVVKTTAVQKVLEGECGVVHIRLNTFTMRILSAIIGSSQVQICRNG